MESMATRMCRVENLFKGVLIIVKICSFGMEIRMAWFPLPLTTGIWDLMILSLVNILKRTGCNPKIRRALELF